MTEVFWGGAPGDFQTRAGDVAGANNHSPLLLRRIVEARPAEFVRPNLPARHLAGRWRKGEILMSERRAGRVDLHSHRRAGVFMGWKSSPIHFFARVRALQNFAISGKGDDIKKSHK
jgi:hypothetical protein